MVFGENFANLAYRNFVSFSKNLGLPMEGFKKEVDSLLRKSEAQKGRKATRSRRKRRLSPASQFEMKLRNLDCSVNYNPSSDKGRRSRKYRLDLISKCLG